MNGWRNRATWLVNLWFEPETVEDINHLEDMLQSEFEAFLKKWMFGGFYCDLIDFTAIDWDELRNAMPTEEE
mgnify:CR=1 FL=1